jgi:nucleoside diphosphate kinase
LHTNDPRLPALLHQVDGVFVINGFYMSMRGKYTTAPASIYYFTTEWEASELSWDDFRNKVLGATDPASAEAGSLRNTVYQQWKEQGLPALPDTGDNGIHASASPFEAMSERMNWLNVELDDDDFAKGMMASGISAETINLWRNDPQVVVGDAKVSLFDSLEDMSSKECLAKAVEIHGDNK